MPLFDSPFMISRKDMFRLQGGSDPRHGGKTRFMAATCAQLMLAHFRAGDSEFSVSLFGNGSDPSFFRHLERELAERGMPEECELIRYGLYGMQCRLQKRATDKQLLRYTKNRCDLMIKKFWRHMESAAVVAYALVHYPGSVIHVQNISAKYLFIYHAHVLCMIRLQFIDRSWVRARVTRHASMKFWLDIGPRSALTFKTYVNIDALQGSDGINYVWDQHRMLFVQCLADRFYIHV